MINKYFFRSRIFEARFKQIIKLFGEDLSATEVEAPMVKLSYLVSLKEMEKYIPKLLLMFQKPHCNKLLEEG